MQGSGAREEGARAYLLMRSCYIDVLFPFCFTNERKALIWCLGCGKGQKYFLTSPKWKWNISISISIKAASKHLSEVRVCDQQSGFPLRWPRHQTSPLDLKELLMSPAEPGDSLEMGGLDFPHWLHTILCQRTSPPTTGNKPFLGHRNLMRERRRKADKHIWGLNWPRQEWDKSRDQLPL